MGSVKGAIGRWFSQEIKKIGSKSGPGFSVVGFVAVVIAADQWFKGNTRFADIVGLIGAGIIYSGLSD